MLGRPALGLAKFSARAQRQHRTVQLQAKLGQGAGSALRVNLQIGARVWLGQVSAGLIGQGHKALDHQRVTLFVELAHIVKQAVAELAAPAGTGGNARKKRHQCRFQRVGQQNCLIVLALEGLADLASRGQFERAMTEREAQGLANFRHALKDGPAPLGSQHIDFALRVALLEALEQCLRHHHVTDPAGPNDQNIHKFP